MKLPLLICMAAVLLGSFCIAIAALRSRGAEVVQVKAELEAAKAAHSAGADWLQAELAAAQAEVVQVKAELVAAKAAHTAGADELQAGLAAAQAEVVQVKGELVAAEAAPELASQLMRALRTEHTFSTRPPDTNSDVTFFSLVTQHSPIPPAPMLRQLLHSLQFSFAEVVVLIDNQQHMLVGDHVDPFGTEELTEPFLELVQSLAVLLHEGVITRVALIDHSESSARKSLGWLFGPTRISSSDSGLVEMLCKACTGGGLFIQELSALQQCNTRYCAVFGSDILSRGGTSSWIRSAVAMLETKPLVFAAIAPLYCNPESDPWTLDSGFSDRYYLVDLKRFDALLPVPMSVLPGSPAEHNLMFEDVIIQLAGALNYSSVAWAGRHAELSVLHPPDEPSVIQGMFEPFEDSPRCKGALHKERCARELGAAALAKLGGQSVFGDLGCHEPRWTNIVDHSSVALALEREARRPLV